MTCLGASQKRATQLLKCGSFTGFTFSFTVISLMLQAGTGSSLSAGKDDREEGAAGRVNNGGSVGEEMDSGGG